MPFTRPVTSKKGGGGEGRKKQKELQIRSLDDRNKGFFVVRSFHSFETFPLSYPPSPSLAMMALHCGICRWN